MNYIDRTLNLNAQALALLELLTTYNLPESLFSVTTGAWYNGRERGVWLQLTLTPGGKAAHIVWAENRNSDNIVVYNWASSGSYLNPPTPSHPDFTDAVYRAATYVPHGRLDLAWDHITALIEAAVKSPASIDLYRCDNTANSCGTSLQTYFTASYARLVELFGPPAESDGYKVSGEWVFTSDPITGRRETFTIYDYRETELYASSLPTIEEFRAQPSYDWHIGGKNKESADRFVAWLQTKLNG